MTRPSRHGLAWLAASAVALAGLLLLYVTSSRSTPPTHPSVPNASWPILQTIVAFALFDAALLAGLIVARLRARPARLSPRALLVTAAIAAGLSLTLLVALLDWPITPSILLWTLVLVAGFAVLLALGLAWSARRDRQKPASPGTTPAPDAAPNDQTLAPAEADPPDSPSDGHADALAPLVALLDGDREAASQRVAVEQTLDPGASYRECVARATYKVLRDPV